MKKVCVDVDSVILNFYEALRRRLADKGITFYPERSIDYSFNGDIGCPKDAIFATFNEPQLYEYLQFLDGAEEAIALLHKHCNVHSYTASVPHEEIYNKRVHFVESLGMVPNVYVGKKPVIYDADALFDDCLDVHRAWIEGNSTAKLYLINAYSNQVRPENADDPIWDKVIRCDSLLDAVKKYIATL
jgi:5'(3')-deoxyribonucleotidase